MSFSICCASFWFMAFIFGLSSAKFGLGASDMGVEFYVIGLIFEHIL